MIIGGVQNATAILLVFCVTTVKDHVRGMIRLINKRDTILGGRIGQPKNSDLKGNTFEVIGKSYDCSMVFQ